MGNYKEEHGNDGPNVALFVDGPNMLRKEFMIDLRELRRRVLKYGKLMIAKVFINQFAPEKLIEAIINEGYECVVILAQQQEDASDVDVSLAVAAIETILARDVDVIALATRDADFLPVVQKAKEYGKRTVILGAEPGFSSSLQNAADAVEMM
ncbi:MAG: NYN domain-containing protein [Candidatus Aenigmarchaeota archaeon]|nr:NYN domain-containing protein [Candidatus Aenigmarchaeota archaeon]